MQRTTNMSTTLVKTSTGVEFRRCVRKSAKVEEDEVASALTAAGTEESSKLEQRNQVCKALLTLVGIDPSQAKFL